MSIHCDKDVTHCDCDMIPGMLVWIDIAQRCSLLYNDAKLRCPDILKHTAGWIVSYVVCALHFTYLSNNKYHCLSSVVII